MRSYFGEFYRGREIFCKVLGEMRRHGLASKDSVQSLRDALDIELKFIFDMRHSFAHGEGGLNGKSYNMVRAYEGFSRKRPMVGPDGKKVPIFVALEPECRARAKAIKAGAEVFRAAFGVMVDILAGKHGTLTAR